MTWKHMKAFLVIFSFGISMMLFRTTLCGIESNQALQGMRLYLDGGEAIRTITVHDLREGEEIVVNSLPGSTDPGSLQAQILNEDQIRLLSVRFERIPPQNLPKSPEHQAAEAALQRISRDLEDLKWRIEAAGERVQFYGEIRKAILKGMEESPETSLSDKAWANFDDGQKALQAQRQLQRDLQDKIANLEEEKALASQRLKEAIGKESALNGQVILEVSGSGSFTIRLQTRIGNTGWQPVYRVNAVPEAGLWEWEYGARIHNQTGEDWEAVPVTLLTGGPGWRMEAPQFPPVYLEKPQPPEILSNKQEPNLFVRQATMAGTTLNSFQVETQRLTTQFSLDVPDPVSIKGFDPDQTVNLVRKSFPARFWSAVTPSVDRTAYLHAKATNDTDLPILPGPATLLVDGAISGNSILAFTNPGDTLELGFGENPGIEVEFKVLDVLSRNSGIFDKVRKYQRHFETVVKNHMPVAHTVQVNSGFPISRDAQIEVNRLEPTQIDVDPETGRFEWEKSIPSGSDASFSTRFEVVAPRDWDISRFF